MPKPAQRPPPAPVYFSSAAVAEISADATLPAKLGRLLKKFNLAHLCQNAWVPIKMHLGGSLGFTTIHPVFVRTIVNAVKEAGGQPFIVEGVFGSVVTAASRGYTPETLGCPIVSAGGPYDSHLVTRKVGYRNLDVVRIFGAIWDAPCLINLSHAKGHGDCGYGGACKNLAMGCVDQATRMKIHALSGGIRWVKERCSFCGKCAKVCDTGAIDLDPAAKTLEIFYHNCRYCRHCISACPRKALTVEKTGGFVHFQEGMALATRAVLNSFDPTRVLHINILTDITMLCDCWGLSTPSIVPDVGILAAHDIVAVEQATVDAIKTEDFIPGSLVANREFVKGRTLFEKIHGKDPLVQIRALERHGLGTRRYELADVK